MSGFAPINSHLDYWQKQTKPLFADLAWNLPEQRTGTAAVIGGNSQNFANVVRTAEFLNKNFPLQHVTTILPSALRDKLPSMENVNFTPSTSSGSFAKSYELERFIYESNLTLLAGDFSKNAETAIAITDAVRQSQNLLIITRDSVDLLTPSASQLLIHPRLVIIGSMMQLQKIFRSVYYPRMIMLSQPLLPVLETLHKFTLSYPATIVTFHQDQIIVAQQGNITTTHISDTPYSPLTLWSGQLAAKIAAFNLFNSTKPLEATTAAILYET